MAKTARKQTHVTPVTPGSFLSWPSPWVAAAIYFGLSLVFFLPSFLPGRHIYGTDYLGGGYFFYHFISERLAAGDLPKWIPYIFGGLPLFSNPGSTYQPVHFLSDLLLPMQRVLPAVFVVHFALAGIGMYLLARELDCRRWIAFVAGLSFQFTGILMSWVYAGHDGRIIVASVGPMLFFFLHRGIRLAEPASFAGVAGTLALALLSFQIQNSYYLLLAAAIWAVFCLLHRGLHRRGRYLGKVVGMGLAAVAFGFVLSSVNFLPFISYIPESPRGMEGGRGYEYSTSFSMPVPELFSLAVPEQAGASVSDPVTGQPLFPQYRGQNPFKLHTEYVGSLVIVLLVLGFFYTRRDRYWQFFLGLSLFMLSIALGGNTPLYRLYYEILPGTKQFRAPSLAFFVVTIALAAMAALTLEQIARLHDRAREPRTGGEAASTLERVPWIAASVAGFALLGLLTVGAGAGASAPGEPSVAAGWSRLLLFSGIIAGGLWVWSRERMGTLALAILLTVVSLADLWSVGRRFFHTVDPPEVTFAADDVILFLQRQEQPVRMWTFPAPQHYRGAGSYGGNFPMLYGIEQVGGEHPNQLHRWNEYVGAGTETYIDWHNLITEASVVEMPEGYQAISFREQEGFLNAASVRYIVSMAPLDHPNLQVVHSGSALVYENIAALPRAYLVAEARPVAGETMLQSMREEGWDPRRTAFVPSDAGLNLPDGPLQGSAQILQHSPDRVVVRTETDRPALLVLADNFYEGWTATVAGVETPIVRVNHTFRGVPVGAGAQEIVFEFRPDDFFLGLYISIAAFALLFGYLLFILVRHRSTRLPAVTAT
ncbi:YfhO family protein [soil metagenome]